LLELAPERPGRVLDLGCGDGEVLARVIDARVEPEDDDPSNQLASVEAQLGWFRGCGLEQVDCHWKWRELALLGGMRPL
jgi:hypothetical protein